MRTLVVNDIFESISGEAGGGFPQGAWMSAVRLQGCNLVDPDTGKGGCAWCDTPKAKHSDSGQSMSVEEIADRCLRTNVLITGGEPLLQREGVRELSHMLISLGHTVQIETNGSIPIFTTPGLHWVVDYKCPSSGMQDKMCPISDFAYWAEQYRHMPGSVSVKWVVSDKEDLDFALERISKLYRTYCVHVISPIDGDGRKIQEFAKYIEEKDSHLLDDIVFSVQLHKWLSMP